MNITIGIILAYMGLLLALGLLSGRMFRGTSKDYFVASRSIGPFLLLMSVFGTTMTAFALVGSTSKAYNEGIGVYGLMASWSGLIHAAVFFMVGIRLWAIGKRNDFVTQCQYFRARFESRNFGFLLFPILVALVIPYLLIGLLGAGRVMAGLTRGAYPEIFPSTGGAIPPWLTGLVICVVVLMYIFFGGLRGAAWANTFQTLVFMIMGVVAFFLISDKLGGLSAATQAVLDTSPEHTAREGLISYQKFLTYCFVPLSVGMFPHLFQHWLTARSAQTFKLTVVMHPICIMIVWVPCILIGIWAHGAGIDVPPERAGQVLGKMVSLLESPVLTGLITAGILAAIMSSLDSQFLCIGSMFTNDVVVEIWGEDHFTDRQKLLLARGFIVGIVIITYLLSLSSPNRVFELGVWCFTGFAGLFPLVFASVYWQRATKIGAYACVITTAATWAFFFIRADWGQHEGMIFDTMPAMWITLSSALAMVIGSLMSQPPEKATLARFFKEVKPA
jgi:SSS family solute:Na+ symporter